MTIHKDCADHLRSYFHALTGGKLGSGHAHELVAAFFGYGSGAALRADTTYPVADLGSAEILIPDLGMMDTRLGELDGLPADLPTADDLAVEIASFLQGNGHFRGELWITRNLAEYIDTDFIQKDPMMIEDELSPIMAETNAYFDELYIEEVEIAPGKEALVANVTGQLNGENDADKPYVGDSINFTTVMTFQRVAGRTAYCRPDLETGGQVDREDYYDEEDA
jgi:hypothetical protein